jgi:hypothetical protein
VIDQLQLEDSARFHDPPGQPTFMGSAAFLMLTQIGAYQPCRLVLGVDGDHGIPARSPSTPRQLLGISTTVTIHSEVRLQVRQRVPYESSVRLLQKGPKCLTLPS